MAIFPCDRCAQRYQGRQRTIYPALMNGVGSTRKKRRLCKPCFEAVVDWGAKALIQTIDNDVTEADADAALQTFSCWSPNCPSQPVTTIFMTVYDVGCGRDEYFGRSCEEHEAGAMLALMASQGQLPQEVMGLVAPAST